MQIFATNFTPGIKIVDQIWARDILVHPHKEARDFFKFIVQKCNNRSSNDPRGILLLRSTYSQGTIFFEAMIHELKSLVAESIQRHLVAANFSHVMVNSLRDSEVDIVIWEGKNSHS